MKECKTCGSTENGFYKSNAKCRKCVNKRLHISKTERVRAEGYRSVYEKKKEEIFKAIMR